MNRRVPKVIAIAAMLLVTCAPPLAAPAFAQSQGNQVGVKNNCPPGAAECDVPAQGSEPVWATVNALAQENYPGGNEEFDVFVIDSATNLYETVTVDNMTLSSPFYNNFGIGLPTTLNPGQSLLSTIDLPIPSNYTQSSFTANLVIHARLWNGTAYNSVTLTGTAPVNVIPYGGSASKTTSTSVQVSSSGTVSTTFFAIGVAAPSIIVIVLLALLIQSRSRPKVAGA